jgi:DNA-binding response OmpR family regulator
MSHKVLVIDDDADICGLVSIALKNKGLDVRVAETGGEGLRSYTEFQPDIVLLDHRLPDMDGNEVARKMKGSSSDKKIPIIAMSGEEVSGEAIDATLYAGRLKKPFRLADMVAYVERHIPK